MVSALRVDKLRRDPDPRTTTANTALQQIAHAQLPPDLLHIDGAALVDEAGIPGDHEEPSHTR